MTTILKLRVQAQNEPYTRPTDGIFRRGAISVSGRYVLDLSAGSVNTLAQYLGKTQAQVENQILTGWMADFPAVKPEFANRLILDMEDPHPSDLGYLLDSNGDVIVPHQAVTAQQRDDRIAAYRTRIKAARKVFPNAQIGMYGVLVPDGQGRPTAQAYLDAHAACVDAGTRGCFDDLDYITPVLYNRFGPTDGAAWTTYATMAAQGIDGSRDIHRSDGREIPLIPLLNSTVNNGNSNHHRQYIKDLPTPNPVANTIGIIVGVLEAKNVEEAFFWVGQNSYVLDLNGSVNANGWTVGDYEVDLRPTEAKDGLATRRTRGSRI